jgi:hypothetical protein
MKRQTQSHQRDPAGRSNTGTHTNRLLLLLALATGGASLLMGIATAAGLQQWAGTTASPLAIADIPPVALDAYRHAAATACDDITWPLLAGIGKIESNHARHAGTELHPNGDTTPPILGPKLDGSGAGGNTTPLPAATWSGRWGLGTDWQQALGPMQFLPGAFEHYAPSPAATPHNIYDAAQAAAALLCDSENDDATTALLRYNRSTAYGEQVLHWAALYADSTIPPSPGARSLLDNENLALTTPARQDLENGIVDPRLVDLLTHIADQYQIEVLNFRTGHPRCKVLPNPTNTGPNCAVSNHWHGRAADITAVSKPGQPLGAVSPHNEPARAIVQSLATLPDEPSRPDEVGSPWSDLDDYHGHFSNQLHENHLHIGYTTQPPKII